MNTKNSYTITISVNYIEQKKSRIKLWLLAIAVVFLIFYFIE